MAVPAEGETTVADIYYVKMNSGEEIVSEMARKGDGLALIDPMTIEYGDDEGKRMIFMTRYAPFVEGHKMVVDRKSVAFVAPVMVEVAEYYQKTKEYCRSVADESFRKGMRMAGVWTGEMADEDGQQSEDELTIDFTPDKRMLH